jgi:hypothetical protein
LYSELNNYKQNQFKNSTARLRIFHAGFQPAWPASRMEYARWACLFFNSSGIPNS